MVRLLWLLGESLFSYLKKYGSDNSNFVIYQALATVSRGYTNQVRVGGLMKINGFETRVDGFCLCKRELYLPAYLGAKC